MALCLLGIAVTHEVTASMPCPKCMLSHMRMRMRLSAIVDCVGGYRAGGMGALPRLSLRDRTENVLYVLYNTTLA